MFEDITQSGSIIKHAYVDGHVFGEYVAAVQNMIHERAQLLQAEALQHHATGEHEAYEDAEYCGLCQAKPWAGVLASLREQQQRLNELGAEHTAGYWLQRGVRDAQYALEHWTGYPAHSDEPMPDGWTPGDTEQRMQHEHDGRLRTRCPACQAVYGRLGRVCALQYVDMAYGKRPAKTAKKPVRDAVAE